MDDDRKKDGSSGRRKSIRLSEYDYSQAGLYFITLCTRNRSCLFGEIVGAGSKPAHVDNTGLPGVDLAPAGTGLEPAPTGYALAEIVRQLKTFSAKRINKTRNTPGTTIWQRNYYEHIIRNEASYLKIAEYIQTNPLKWQEDIYHV